MVFPVLYIVYCILLMIIFVCSSTGVLPTTIKFCIVRYKYDYNFQYFSSTIWSHFISTTISLMFHQFFSKSYQGYCFECSIKFSFTTLLIEIIAPWRHFYHQISLIQMSIMNREGVHFTSRPSSLHCSKFQFTSSNLLPYHVADIYLPHRFPSSHSKSSLFFIFLSFFLHPDFFSQDL